MAAGILRTPAGAVTGGRLEATAALMATAFGSSAFTAAVACGTMAGPDLPIIGLLAAGAFARTACFFNGAFLVSSGFAGTLTDRLAWVLAGCALRLAALADGEERAPALEVTRFLGSAFFGALLLGFDFRTMSIISL
jgi:hypothetical protein